MLQLLLLYVLIVIFELLYIHYFPNNIESEKMKELNEKILFNKKHEPEIDKVITEKLKEYASLINHGKLTYNDWCIFLRDHNLIKIGNFNYTLAGLQSVPNSSEIISIVAAKSNELKTNLDISLFSEIVKLKSAEQVNAVNMLETVHPSVMMQTSSFDRVHYLTYRWIDPDTGENVIRKSLYTKWRSKDDESGVILIGYNVENINFLKRYKYLDLIYKPELCLTSISLFILSTIMFKIKAFEHEKIKSIAFLVITNIYLLYFINTNEYYSDIAHELQKNSDINSSILNVSFLSTVNIFIMNFIYANHKKLFMETASIFCVSMILLLTAIYKAANKNSLAKIVGARITNQLVFNMSVFLNATIILNFLYYSVFMNNKK
jgi:hypothetical protein